MHTRTARRDRGGNGKGSEEGESMVIPKGVEGGLVEDGEDRGRRSNGGNERSGGGSDHEDERGRKEGHGRDDGSSQGGDEEPIGGWQASWAARLIAVTALVWLASGAMPLMGE